MLAHVTTATTTDQAANIHLCTRLGERKIGRTETHFYILAEHFLHKEVKCLLKVGKTYIFIYIQAFYLVEEAMRTGADSLIAIYTTRAYYPDRWTLRFHYPCLYAAGMR